jgi:hypothetical protein
MLSSIDAHGCSGVVPSLTCPTSLRKRVKVLPVLPISDPFHGTRSLNSDRSGEAGQTQYE